MMWERKPWEHLLEINEATKEANLAIANRFYHAAFEGNFDSVADLFSDDLRVWEAEGLPFHATFRGKMALKQLYAHMTSFWSGFRADLKALTVGQGYIIGVLEASAKVRGGEGTFTMDIAEIIRIENGQIVELYPIWWDTKRIAELFEGHSQSKAPSCG